MAQGDDDKDLALGETIANTSPSAPDQGEARLGDLALGMVIDAHYVIETVIGRGGMGTVYLVKDTTLGRAVALKLHRHGSGSDRLYREALAMAQLAHPNVVTVYEVGTHDDQLYVAMEYVKGSTLRGWLAAAPRTWQQIAALLREVGEGLAAAHKAELVHRDFKPENVLVGEDGRPRVGDFGLARGNAAMSSMSSTGTRNLRFGVSADTLSMESSGSASSLHTQVGTVLGTPAYMSPEQFAGANVDARTDQFSFCVAAWECLHGARPFLGDNVASLQQAVERGEVAVPAKTAVPVQVRKVLRRGLSARAAERWPDMRALLGALGDAVAPRRGKRMALAAGAVVGALAIAGGAAWVLRGGSHAVSCDAAGAELDELVPETLRTGVIALAKKTGTPDAAQRTEKHIGEFLTAYRDAAKHACRAERAHDWSAELAQRSARCRDEQGRIANAELERALAGSESGDYLARVTAELRDRADLAPCSDATALAAFRPMAANADATAIATARAQLVTAHHAAPEPGAGIAYARTTVARIGDSPLALDPSVVGPLGIARAAIARKDEQFDAAIKGAGDAYYAAHGQGDALVEVLALSDLLIWLGEREDPKGVEPWYRLALAEVDRLRAASPVRASQLRAAIAQIAVLRDELPVGIEQARLAVEESLGASDAKRASLLANHANMLATSGDTDRSLPLYEQSEKLYADTLGPDSAELLHTLGDEALTLSDAGRHDDAVKVVERALPKIQAAPSRVFEVANAELNFGVVFFRADDDARAEPLFRDARAIIVKIFGPKHPLIATIDVDLALIEEDRDAYPAATQLLTEALAIQEATLGPDHTDVANTLFNLATTHEKQKDPEGALVPLERCIAIRARKQASNDLYVFALTERAVIENELKHFEAALRDAKAALAVSSPHSDFQATAWPQLEQAKALLGLHGDADTARRLLRAARAAYAANKMEKRLTEIDILLATPR